MNHFLLATALTALCCSIGYQCKAQETSLLLEIEKLDFQLRDMKSPAKTVERDFPNQVKRTVDAYWDKKQIKHLMESKDNTIAMLGAWRLASGANKEDALGSVHWFCGFFEGRTGLSPPAAWKYHLSDQLGVKISAPSEYLELNSSRGDASLIQDIPVGHITIRTYKPQNICVEGDRISFRKCDLVCQVDRLTLQVSGKGRREIEYAMNSQHLAVALSSAPSMSDVLLFDSQSGKLLWHRQTWGNLETRRVKEYVGFRHPTVVLRSEEVAVFGDSDSSPYCEIYECKSGICTLRFSSSTWDAR